MEKDEVIKSLREGLALKTELIDRLKGDHAKELAARDEKYNSLLKAFEGFGSMVKSAVLQLAGWSCIPLIIHILGNQHESLTYFLPFLS